MSKSSPYPGLRPFRRDESDIFFGREEQTDQLLEKLGHSRFLAVVGPSGCGKSSLVRAGMMAALEVGFMVSAGVRWRVAEMRPGNHPLLRLAEALLEPSALGSERREGDSAAVAFLHATLRRGPLGLSEAVREMPLPDNTNILLLVDQFEEIFRYRREGDPDETDAFVGLLLAAAAQREARIYVALTMRSDFLGECSVFQGLPEAMNDSQFLTPRLTREQARAAIVGPAAVHQGTIAPNLVNRLLNDMTTGLDQLPLMQHVLMRMWARVSCVQSDPGTGATAQRSGAAEDITLTLGDYNAVGGLAKALSYHADEAFGELDVGQQRVAEVLFRALTERSAAQRDMRRPVRLGSVAAVAGVAPNEVRAVVEVFRRPDRSFLTPPVPAALHPDTVLDISHESLIRQWERLDTWAADEMSSAETYRRLEQTALLWKIGGAALWGTPDLENALRWQERARPNALWAERYGGNFDLAIEFLAASAQHREAQEAKVEADRQRELDRARSLAELQEQRAETERQRAEEQRQAAKRFRRLAASLAVVSLLAVGAALYAWTQQILVARHSQLALSGRLAAAAMINLTLDPERSVLLALHAAAATYGTEQRVTAEAEHAMHQAVQASRIRRTLAGHSRAVHAVAFSPDGQRVATAGGDGAVKVWDTQSGQEMGHVVTQSDAVTDVVFSPDGQRLATAGSDGTARLWDALSGAEVLVFRGHDAPVTSVAFSPDGTRLATSSRDTTARVWDVASGREVFKLVGHTYDVHAVAFSPDGLHLAIGGGDRTVTLWDATSGTPQRVFYGHGDAVIAVAFHPYEKRLATASADRTVKVWDAVSGTVLLTLQGQTFDVNDVAFSPDGTRLATASGDSTAKVWDASIGRELFTLYGHRNLVSAVAFSPDGTQLLTGSTDKTAKIWHLVASQELLTLRGHDGMVINVAFSPDGARLATASEDGTVKVWDAGSGQELLFVSAHAYHANDVAFSPDGTRLATAGGDTTVKLWNAASGQALATLSGHRDAVFGLAFSPDGMRLATASFDGTAKVWDLSSQREILILSGHLDGVNGVAFSPDGRRVATTSDDRTAKLWDAASGQELMSLNGHTDLVTRVAFSPDGARLVTASKDGTAKLWDAASGQELLTLFGHTNTVFGVAFSPDRRRVVTTSWDRTARVWDAASGQELLTLSSHTDKVNGVAFSPDGRRLATAGWDKTVQLYAVHIDDLMALSRSRVTRALTAAECRQYLYVNACPSLRPLLSPGTSSP